MTLVATVALGSSTYAWFAINSKVTATGMNFTTKVQDNLFIATAAHESTTIVSEENFRTTEIQSVGGILEPVSSKDGMSFWYSETNNVNGNGSVKNPIWKNYGTEGLTVAAGKTNNNFSLNNIPNDSAKALGFIDYVYDIKAVASGATTLNLTRLDLMYADEVSELTNSAFRVAVFVEKATNESGAENNGSNYIVNEADNNTDVDGKAEVKGTAATWIFAPSGKGNNNFTTKGTENAVVTAADSVEKMTYQTEPATIAIAGQGTHYYKVVVRVWLEGQDKNCNNTTFAKLDDGKWGLTTEWTLGNATGTPVTSINVMQYTKADVDLSEDVSISTEDTYTINGVVYSALTGKNITVGDQSLTLYVAGNESTPAAAINENSKIYTIVDGQLTDVTHLVKLK